MPLAARRAAAKRQLQAVAQRHRETAKPILPPDCAHAPTGLVRRRAGPWYRVVRGAVHRWPD